MMVIGSYNSIHLSVQVLKTSRGRGRLTVHLLEVRNLLQVADVDDGEVLDSVGDLVKDFVLFHAVWIVVATEADHDEPFIFVHDCLVDVPSCAEMGENDGTHVQC